MIKSEIEYVMEDGIEYKIETIYEEKENGEKVIRGRVKTPNDNSEPVAPEPSQLDRIESAINKTQAEIAQEARDAYTLELINSGII